MSLNKFLKYYSQQHLQFSPNKSEFSIIKERTNKKRWTNSLSLFRLNSTQVNSTKLYKTYHKSLLSNWIYIHTVFPPSDVIINIKVYFSISQGGRSFNCSVIQRAIDRVLYIEWIGMYMSECEYGGCWNWVKSFEL